ncbi:MAG: hypothetical protein MUP58_01075 [Candidatus Nanohaloarchaeota archaeon QJJ-9]|nr:hypothetical protein [Candidatus Nanohaloarchaeota archaeon QJJ-9]
MAHTFHDLNIHSKAGEGKNSVEEIAERAELLDIDRIAICNTLNGYHEVEELKNSIGELDTTVNVHPGVRIKAEDTKELKDQLSAYRDSVDVIVVDGGDEDINRAACEDSRVDILSHPEYKRKDQGIDHVIAKKAAKNRVAIEINFRTVLNTYRKVRSQIMHHMKQNVKLARKYHAPLILNSGAKRIEELRKPRDTVGFACSLGLNLSEAFKLVEGNPAQIIQRATETHSENQVRPGIEVEKDES